MIGQTLGHYRVMEQIGAGGMGLVFRAHDERLDREVALKVLPPGTLTDENARKRFRKEALTLSKLNHPNIATIFDFDTQDGVGFLVMELILGVTLDEKLKGGAFPEKEVIRLGMQLTEGLAAAHAEGVVHRDLKPGNLRLTPDGRLKILDFGLAKLLRPVSDVAATESLSKTHGAVGTLPYMAPEQLQGEPADARSDIWAAGAVLYELATGKRPFPQSSTPMLTDAILRQAMVPPRAVNANLSPELERTITKSLEKEPENRYQTAKELEVDLRRLATSAAAPTAVPVRSRPARRRTRRKAVRCLAVLPLENLSRDPEQEYFADGMTEALITELSKVGALRVISRTSAMQYKGVKKPLPEIARELNADALVEGSILRVGGRVRITAQLIHAESDEHLWAESYDRDLHDVLTLQSEVAQAIVREIKIQLTPQERARFRPTRPVHPEAHDAYLRGRFHWNKRTEEATKKAAEHFRHAIEKDPSYALAYVGLADCYNVLGFYAILPPRESFPKAKAAALKALELDGTVAEAHASLAYANFYYEWDFRQAEQDFKQAIERNPAYAIAHQWGANPLTAMGRHTEAIARVKRARDLDPLSLVINASVGWLLYYARRYGEAVEECKKTLEMDPNFALARLWLSWALEQTGKYQEATEEARMAMSLSGGVPYYLASLSHTYAVAGNRQEAQRLLHELDELSKHTYVSPYYRAEILAGLGSVEDAIVWLEKAYEERSNLLVFSRVEPKLDPLRSHPRFQALLRRIGLEPANAPAEHGGGVAKAPPAK